MKYRYHRKKIRYDWKQTFPFTAHLYDTYTYIGGHITKAIASSFEGNAFVRKGGTTQNWKTSQSWMLAIKNFKLENKCKSNILQYH
jgi:hypothetical protein